MRDRLIELVKASVYGNIDDGFDGPVLNCENVADHLLANDVIVPPCKVGDKLFRVVELFNGERFVVEGIAFEYTETFEHGTIKKRIYFWANGEEFTRRNYSLWLEISEIGKTVFLTREEAETEYPFRDDLPRCKDALRRANEMGMALEKENQELKAEIERLQGVVRHLKQYDEERDIRLHARLTEKARDEAIKEFAEVLKFNVTGIPWCEYGPVHREIDNLVKEMVGE